MHTWSDARPFCSGSDSSARCVICTTLDVRRVLLMKDSQTLYKSSVPANPLSQISISLSFNFKKRFQDQRITVIEKFTFITTEKHA